MNKKETEKKPIFDRTKLPRRTAGILFPVLPQNSISVEMEVEVGLDEKRK